MPTPKKYPRTLSAPVSEELWKWFTDLAEAESRTMGAQLRILIQAQYDREQQREMLGHFAGAVVRDGRPGVANAFLLSEAEASVALDRDQTQSIDDPEEGVA